MLVTWFTFPRRSVLIKFASLSIILTLLLFAIRGCLYLLEPECHYDKLEFDAATSRLIALNRNDETTYIEIYDVDLAHRKLTNKITFRKETGGDPFHQDEVQQVSGSTYQISLKNVVYTLDVQKRVLAPTHQYKDNLGIDGQLACSLLPACNAQTGKARKNFPFVMDYMTFTPSGRKIAMGDTQQKNSLMVFEGASSFRVNMRTYKDKGINDAMFIDETNLLVAVEYVGVVRVDTVNHTVNSLLDIGASAFHFWRLGADSVAVSTRTNNSKIYFFSPATGKVQCISENSQLVSSLAYIPKSQTMIVGGKDIRFVDAPLQEK